MTPEPQKNCGAPRGWLEHQQDKKEVLQRRAGSPFGDKLQAVGHGRRPEIAHQQEGMNPRLQSPPRGGNAGHKASPKERKKSERAMNRANACPIERTPGIEDPGLLGPKRRGVQRDTDLIAEVSKSWALRKAVGQIAHRSTAEHAREQRTEVAGCTTTWERVVAPPAETPEPGVGRQGRTPINCSVTD